MLRAERGRDLQRAACFNGQVLLPCCCSESHYLMVSLLKCLNPANQLLDRIGIIAGIESAQRQIGIEDSDASCRTVEPKFDFGSYGFDMPMCFKRYRLGKFGARSYRLSKHEDISADAQLPCSTLSGEKLPSA